MTTKQKCTIPIHHKIANRSGKLQTIMESLFEVARASIDPHGDEEMVEQVLWELAEIVQGYGVVWLDETKTLFKVLNHEGEEA